MPSEAEFKEAQLALEQKRANTIKIPPDTIVQSFAGLLNPALKSPLTPLTGAKSFSSSGNVTLARVLFPSKIIVCELTLGVVS